MGEDREGERREDELTRARAGNSAGLASISPVHHSGKLTGAQLRVERVEHVIVPYKGGGPALIGLMSGETDFLFATAPSAMPHIRSGRLRPIAVTTEKKSSAFKDLPTMSEFYPGFASDNWYAMFFRAGTPKPIIDKINSEIRKALNSASVAKFMAGEGLDAVGSTPGELGALLKREITKYAKVIKQANIKLR